MVVFFTIILSIEIAFQLDVIAISRGSNFLPSSDHNGRWTKLIPVNYLCGSALLFRFHIPDCNLLELKLPQYALRNLLNDCGFFMYFWLRSYLKN